MVQTRVTHKPKDRLSGPPEEKPIGGGSRIGRRCRSIGDEIPLINGLGPLWGSFPELMLFKIFDLRGF